MMTMTTLTTMSLVLSLTLTAQTPAPATATAAQTGAIVPLSATEGVLVDGKAAVPYKRILPTQSVSVPKGATLVLLIDGHQRVVEGPQSGPLQSLLPPAKADGGSHVGAAARALAHLFFEGTDEKQIGGTRAIHPSFFPMPSSSAFRKGGAQLRVRLPERRPPLAVNGDAGAVAGNVVIVASETTVTAGGVPVARYVPLAAADDAALEARLAEAKTLCGGDPGWCALLRAEVLAAAGCVAEAEDVVAGLRSTLGGAKQPWRALEASVQVTWAPSKTGTFVSVAPEGNGQRGGVLRLAVEASRPLRVVVVGEEGGAHKVIGTIDAAALAKKIGKLAVGVRGAVDVPAGMDAGSVLVIFDTKSPALRTAQDGDVVDAATVAELRRNTGAFFVDGATVGGGFGQVVLALVDAQAHAQAQAQPKTK